MDIDHKNIQLRIQPKDEATGAYPVEARLDDGSRFSKGKLHLDLENLRQAALELDVDPELGDHRFRPTAIDGA